ncbi:hypothetical protein X753_21120 [Mesorhizobium sp. LNJC399B00]|nr:hypothetical protein X756_00795 [Mesorhizobium sp. LSHC412B00]ESY03873.1 hypothetical protein X753_21120 [Mesorhizobium sp. LNJC399B00]
MHDNDKPYVLLCRRLNRLEVDIAVSGAPTIPKSRFSDALADCVQKLEDKPLVQGLHNVVLPTIGMIVPNWFLVVPKVHSFNFGQQGMGTREELSSIASSIFEAVSKPGDEMLAFEHGALRAGSNIGCGVDHAHLHIIVSSRNFLACVWDGMSEELDACDGAAPIGEMYNGVLSEKPYYLAWMSGKTLLEQPAKNEVSQRFRRVIASAAGTPDSWNYREHPFYDNVLKTISNFHQGKRQAA